MPFLIETGDGKKYKLITNLFNFRNDKLIEFQMGDVVKVTLHLEKEKAAQISEINNGSTIAELNLEVSHKQIHMDVKVGSLILNGNVHTSEIILRPLNKKTEHIVKRILPVEDCGSQKSGQFA